MNRTERNKSTDIVLERVLKNNGNHTRINNLIKMLLTIECSEQRN